MLEVVPNLWLGNAMEIRDPKLLFDLGVRTIIDLAYEEQPLVPARQFLYFRFPIADSNGSDRLVTKLAIQTLQELLSTNVPTAVGCSAGMSRSPTISAFAIQIQSGLDAKKVVEQIAHQRALEINPALWNEVESCVDQMFEGK